MSDSAETGSGSQATAGTIFAGRRSLIAALLLFLLASLAAWWQPPRASLAEPSFVAALAYPIERNPEDRLPVVGRNLAAVAMSGDGQRAVAVGEGGSILTSNDGGQGWTAQTSGTSSKLYGVALSDGGQRAVAVGDNGSILTSSDGGQSWTARTSGTSALLQSVAISADGQRAVAVGFNDSILTSSDGGQSWTAWTSGASGAIGASVLLESVALSADGQRALAQGLAGSILTSSDGGQSWTGRTSGAGETLLGVALSAAGQRAVAVGLDGGILTSSDGGQSWTPRASGTSALRGVALSDDGQRAVAVGEDGRILTSSDGGQFWTARTITRGELSGVALSGDGQRAVAVGNYGSILTNSDGGQGWTARTSSTSAWLFDVALSADGERAVAVGYFGSTLTSSDGGQSWTAERSGTSMLRSIALSGDGQRAVAVGADGRILTSSDGGQGWTARTSGTRSLLFGVALSDDGQRAVAVGEDGRILTSSDGGQGWTARTSGTRSLLFGVALSDDGQRAVAVGENGSILTSSDGGQVWTARTIARSALSGVALSGDGQRAVGVGADGSIMISNDGGQGWTARTSGTRSLLFGVALSGDGQRAVAVGDNGSILTSGDGGQSWTPRELDYRRYPAPWYWLALLVCAILVWRGFAGTARKPDRSAAAVAASDAPAMAIDQDRLNFAPLARGISRFLRNRNTAPPLTLAITGEWGSGKSSLMGQLCADLSDNDRRPVWFNAWHHQNEEQLLAALLVAIRDTGVPPLLSLAGQAFRLRLLLIRIRQNPFPAVAVTAVASLIGSYGWRHADSEKLAGLLALMQAPAGKEPAAATGSMTAVDTLVGAAPGLGTLVTGLLLIIAIARQMKAFGVDPAVLVGASLGKFRLKDAAAQTSFRMRFAEQFGEVTEALAHPMVIVIDDLDRCKPQTVLDTMEAVNFLTTAGRCFVIFGMARERVAAALALSFKDIAAEMAQFDATDESVAAETRQRKSRQDYARDYLEKLINIDIKVPNQAALAASQLLAPPKPKLLDPLARFIAWAKRWALLVSLLVSIFLGMIIAEQLRSPAAQSVPIKPVATNGPAPETGGKPVPAEMPSVPRSIPDEQSSSSRPVLTPGDESEYDALWFGGALLALIGLSAILLLRWLQRQRTIVEDSDDFAQALAAWTPVASRTRNSPRAIKRFGNRVRYLAMLQQSERLDEHGGWEAALAALAARLSRLRARLLRRTDTSIGGTDTGQTAANGMVLSEHRVVALAAIHAEFGEGWRGQAEAGIWVGASDNMVFDPIIGAAITSYQQATGANWPPSEAELDAFQRSLDGVRLAGDVEVIKDKPSPTKRRPQTKKPPSEARKSPTRRAPRPKAEEA